jgi:HEPN domain-containing protein
MGKFRRGRFDYGEKRFEAKKTAYHCLLFSQPAMRGKYLKAILVAKDVEFPKTHDLLILNTLCSTAGIMTGFTKEDLGRLSGYAVHTRYPGNRPVPEDAKEALEITMTIRQFARMFLGLKK